MRRILPPFVFVAAVAAAAIVTAVTGASAQALASGPRGSILTVTRSDLAAALMRFEGAYAASRPDDAERARIHREFDRAAMLYFSAQHADAIAAINRLARSIGKEKSGPHSELSDSLQVRISPPVALRSRPSILRVRIAAMYPMAGASPADLRLVIRTDANDSKVIFDEPIRLDPQGPPVMLTRAQPQAAMGKHIIEIVDPDGAAHPAGRWTVVEAPLEVVRLENDRRLKDLRPTEDALRHALVACRARNTLLSDRPDENNSAQFLADPLELSRQVQSEVEWLTMGKDSYVGRAGDYWRAILAGGMQFPARIYAPRQANDNPDKPLPLVIALHGAGGDESMFMDAYGAGQIKGLADEHGFIVVSPSTYWVIPNAAALDSIIEAMQHVYRIDPSRIYLIGHSLGALAATGMASRQPDKIAGMALFAPAGQFQPDAKLPRTVVYQGELDAIVSAERTRSKVEQAHQAGLPVELRLMAGCGHTLLVHDALPQAIGWLMETEANDRRTRNDE